MTTALRSALIVGAGIAGLACATELARAGITVTLLDKGRRAGGRVATRRIQGMAFNHGAQFATARGEGFATLLTQAQADGQAAPWMAAGSDGRRIAFMPGMSALPAAMTVRAAMLGAVVMNERHAAFLHPGDAGWHVRHLAAGELHAGAVAESGGELSAAHDAVLLALPAPQARALLASAVHSFAAVAARAVMAPCWAVMAQFTEWVPGTDVLQNESGAIAWAAREGSRPGRAAHPDAWTLHASANWSRAHLEESAESVAQALLGEFRALAGAPAPDFAQAHRWRHALVEVAIDAPCLWDPAARVGACGDWCLGGRIEAAYDSGHSLAQCVLNTG
ncbi:MAG: FAD-dependent oxidoreductase [Betaproteobacteria bacterium]